jgi:hypothetical protein
LIAKAAQSGWTPMVLLTDDGAVRLAQICQFEPHAVLGIDAQDLPSVKHAADPVRAPFIMAMRAKYTSSELSTLIFQPYSPKSPVFGWKFFGRRNELAEMIDSPGNVFLVGARMTGKTSLLREAGRLLQEEHGATVHYVGLQYLQSLHEVAPAILRTLAERESVTAVRRSQMLDEPLLESVLKRLSRSHTRTVIILDELGLLLQKSDQRGDDWRLIGILREQSHSGRIKLLMSGYQEFLIKQAEDFNGPYVNFAKTVKLSGFSNQEIDEFLVQPLQFWGQVAGTDLLATTTARVGRHPLFLQYFGKTLFDKVTRRAGSDVNVAAHQLLDSNGITIFEEAVEELFLRTCTAAERFIFLKRCREADLAGEGISDAEITDAWTESVLDAAGYESNYDGRKLLLESLELRALTSKIGTTRRSRQRIAAPIIYSFLKYTEPDIDGLIEVFARDIKHSRHTLLARLDPAQAS